MGQHLTHGFAAHVGDDPPALGFLRWSRGRSTVHSRRAAAHRPAPQSPPPDAYPAVWAASVGDRRSGPPAHRSPDTASRRAALRGDTCRRPLRRRPVPTARAGAPGSECASTCAPTPRAHRVSAGRGSGDPGHSIGGQENCGRLDEDFIHSVRSQLPIRGKYLDHHGSVEALVVGRPAYLGRPCDARSITPNRPAWNLRQVLRAQALIEVMDSDDGRLDRPA